MVFNLPGIAPLTDEEEKRIQKVIAADPDTWELSEESIKNARPFREVFPELYASAKERGLLK